MRRLVLLALGEVPDVLVLGVRRLVLLALGERSLVTFLRHRGSSWWSRRAPEWAPAVLTLYTQSKVLVTAFFHWAYSASISSAPIFGVHSASLPQFWRRSS